MTFEKGNRANPGGRPKEAKLWREALIRAVKRREDEDPQALEKLADKLLLKMEEGDILAMREFGDRIDGKPTQPVSGDEDNPLNHIINVVTGVPRA